MATNIFNLFHNEGAFRLLRDMVNQLRDRREISSREDVMVYKATKKIFS